MQKLMYTLHTADLVIDIGEYAMAVLVLEIGAYATYNKQYNAQKQAHTLHTAV